MHLELRDGTLRFDDHPPLFEGAGLSVAGGDFVVVEGASGCGKSSLLRVLNLLQALTRGEVLVDGAVPAPAAVPQIRARAALVPQTPSPLPGTVRDNLRLPFALRVHRQRRPPPDDELRAQLDQLRLTDVELDDDAAALSVGQRQRLGLLRALLVAPEILLCDEPTSALDDDARRVVEAQLESRCLAGSAIVLVTHQAWTSRNVPVRRCRLADGTLGEVAA